MYKNTQYYNKESVVYSQKRYPVTNTQYTHSFFNKRLEHIIYLLKKIVENKTNLSLLEIGCADGIIIGRIHDTFQKNFSLFVGIDISPEMIRVAQGRFNNDIIFYTRDNFTVRELKDIIIEVGVINYAILKEEIVFSRKLLRDTGYYICSYAGSDSLFNKLKKNKDEFNNFVSYQEFENVLKNNFNLVRVIPVGFFIPYIWKVPCVARFIQPVIEKILKPFVPNLFHEKIYLLKKKL